MEAITEHHITPLLKSHLPVLLMTRPQKKLTNEQHVTADELVQISRQNTASINWLPTLSGKDRRLSSLGIFKAMFVQQKKYSL